MAKASCSVGGPETQVNMEDFLDEWSLFNLTEDEEIHVKASPEVVAKGKSLISVGLVGKLLTSKMVNKRAFQETISQLWRVDGLKIKVLANNIFIFTFSSEAEIDRILSMEPWNFSRSLLLLKRFEGFNMGDVGSFNYTSLWVRAFNVPPSGMIQEVGNLIGNSIGECSSVDAE